MAIALVVGDPCRHFFLGNGLDDVGSLQELKAICESRHKFRGQGNSDLIATVNMYLHGMTCDVKGLRNAGIGEHQAKTFCDEFLHLATRVLTYIRQQCTDLMPNCVEKLQSAATAMRRGSAIGHLTNEPSVDCCKSWPVHRV